MSGPVPSIAAVTPKSVGHRVYADFLMPPRLDAFRRLLSSAIEAGYAIVSIERAWELIKAGEVDPDRRYLVLRHDIDTDPGTGAAMLTVERELGAQGSYFFRLSTLDMGLIAQIAAAGGGVGYHYEELATVAKERRLRTRSEALAHVPEAQERFLQNLGRLRTATGLPLRVAASHGDFVNRSLGLPNWTILADPEVRRTADIELETYDDAFMSHVSSRHSDTHYPRFWIPGGPGPAIARGEPFIYLLVHPRHWRVARLINARDDAGRLVESLLYRRPARRESLAGAG